jgi:hypothetical protein
MVPAVPNSCSSRVTPGLLLLSGLRRGANRCDIHIRTSTGSNNESSRPMPCAGRHQGQRRRDGAGYCFARFTHCVSA